ncbi:MAG: hypothetical protein KJ721_02245 [Nanoarchaeota archaeon]|nr:hypothetical protein [Nanoarchaeota archaeon]
MGGSYKMCRACETKPVYEFTNQRKLCRRCFINWFQKKFLYTIRKFKMIQQGDVVGYFGGDHFRFIVLEEMLKIILQKRDIKLVKLPKSKDTLAVLSKKLKIDSIACPTTCDLGAIYIISEIIKGETNDLIKEAKPVEYLTKTSKFIKPLYLFLDEEVLLYAKLKKLRFVKAKNVRSSAYPNTLKGIKEGQDPKTQNVGVKKDKISMFVDELEKKHPEVKRAVVNWMLGLGG